MCFFFVVCLLVGFASNIFWLGCQSNPKSANEYRQKKPKKCMLCLARDPGRSRDAGTHNLFTFILPTPHEHQQRSSALCLPTELPQVCCLHTPCTKSLGRFSATCPPTGSHPVPESGSLLTCLALYPVSASKDTESLSLPRATVQTDLAGLSTKALVLFTKEQKEEPWKSKTEQ